MSTIIHIIFVDGKLAQMSSKQLLSKTICVSFFMFLLKSPSQITPILTLV